MPNMNPNIKIDFKKIGLWALLIIAICGFILACLGLLWAIKPSKFPMFYMGESNTPIEYKLRDEFETSCISAEVVNNYKIINKDTKEILFQSDDPYKLIEKHRKLISNSPDIPIVMEDGTYQICKQYFVHIAYSVWSKQGDDWISRALLTTDKEKAWSVAVALNNPIKDDMDLLNYGYVPAANFSPKNVEGVYLPENPSTEVNK